MQPSTLNLIQEQLSIELELKTPIVGLHLPKAGWKFVPVQEIKNTRCMVLGHREKNM